MVILQENKKIFCKGIYNTFLANQIRLTYCDSEKDWKTHEIAMKNGNFINDFLVKACSIIVSKVKSQSMAGRGDFSKMWFFSSRYIDIFLCLFLCWRENAHFFGCHFCFGFARVCFKKQQKKVLWHSKVNLALYASKKNQGHNYDA